MSQTYYDDEDSTVSLVPIVSMNDPPFIRVRKEVRVFRGCFLGWEGKVIKVCRKFAIVAFLHRFDRTGEQRKVDKTHLQSIENHNRMIVEKIKLIERLQKLLDEIGSEFVTRREWLAICDIIEMKFFELV
jgi:ribosomal protein L24